MTRLSIYEDGINKPASAVLEGSTRAVYYAATQMIRYYKREEIDIPYMLCSNAKLNLLLTCKRMSINFGFAE